MYIVALWKNDFQNAKRENNKKLLNNQKQQLHLLNDLKIISVYCLFFEFSLISSEMIIK